MNKHLHHTNWYKALIVLLFSLASLTSYGQISVTATAGTLGPTPYTTLNAAINAINAGTHQGIINVSVTASTTETVQSVLNSSGTGSASYTSIRIKPAPATTPTITGNISTYCILQLNGADNVVIDGSNTPGGTTRDLTISNTTTVANSCVVWIACPSAANGALNDTIKNCRITGLGTTNTAAGILTGSGTTFGDFPLAPNSNNSIENNLFSNTQSGIYQLGPAASPFDNGWNISGNTFLTLGYTGMILQYISNYTVRNNSISDVTASTTSVLTGIDFYGSHLNGSIYNNTIGNINNTLSTYGCNGLFLESSSAAANINVYNNTIYNVWSTSGWASALGYTSGDNGYGIMVELGGGYNIYHNTVNLLTSQAAGRVTAAINIGPGLSAGSINLKDNILINAQTTGATRYGIYCRSANTVFASIGFNDYFAVSGNIGFIGGTAITTMPGIASVTTGFGDATSINYNPVTGTGFVSATDLHLTTIAANNALAVGTPITTPLINVDIDGNSRSTTAPTIGADEILNNIISYTALTSTCSNGDIILSGVSITSGAGVPTSGTTMPQIYFKKGAAGTWYHSSGVLTAGSATAGTWDFTITAATMGGVAGGDVIYYYVVAQTTGGTAFANPSTGLVATDVNTVTTPPTTPNNYTVNAVSLSGLTSSQTICFNQGTTASTVAYPYTGSLGTPNQYTLTWLPAGPTDVTAFTAMSSPVNVSVPAGTTAGTYTGTLTIKNATTGCTNTYTLTLVINPAPAAISGMFSLCPGGATTTLTSTTTGGSWSGGSASVATITASGMVTSVGVGSTIVTYTAPVTGCTDTAVVTVISAPNPITGSTTVCVGGVVTLGETTTGGSWSSGLPARATVDATSGAVYGVSAGAVTISYVMPSGCYAIYNMTVGAAPAAITGPGTVCPGETISLSHPVTTGSWSSGTTSVATITAGGVVGGATAGTTDITYAISAGCAAYKTVTVNPLPAAIGGTTTVCAGGALTTLTDATTPGVWSTTGAATIATIGASTGVVTGVGAGSIIVTYTATITGCRTTAMVSVHPLPAAIGGALTICGGGATGMLTNTSGIGTWISGTIAVATVETATGMVTGVSAGTAPVTFTLTATGCQAMAAVTVLPTPATISGTDNVCAGGSVITLSNSGPGSWSISPASVATITTSGMVTGVSAGAATATYTGSNSCYVIKPITVNPLPTAMVGALSVCQTATTTLSSTPGGTWVTGNPFVATVSAGGGVYGVGVGVTPITYTLTTGCRTINAVTVNAIPGPITGSPSICIGGVSTLGNSIGGGTWSVTPTSIVTISATGVAYGVALGNATVTYTNGTAGCYVTLPVNVTGIVAPSIIVSASPSTTICDGTPVTYSAALTNGGATPLYVWSVNNVILSGASSYSYVPANGDIVRCWFISSYACAAPDTASHYVVMHVNPIVIPAVSLSTGMGDTVCTPGLTTITPIPVGGGPSPVYNWWLNGVPSGTGPVYPFAPNNGDVILCRMTTSAPCATAPTANATKVLTVSPMLTPVVTLSSMLGLVACDGYPDVFTTTQVNGGTNPTYQWFVNGVGSGTGANFTYTPTNGDVVQVTMTSNFPCLATPTASANTSLTVLPITQPVGVITAVPGYVVAPGMYDTFTCTIVSGGGIAPLYQWYKNNIPVAGATNSVYITNALNNGDSISCEVTNTDQCSGVSVFGNMNIIVSNNVGVNNVANDMNIALMPNPNKGSFAIKGQLMGAKDATVEIVNMLGQKVYMGSVTTVNGLVDAHIDLQGKLANGMYTLSLKTEGAAIVFHFVLEQ